LALPERAAAGTFASVNRQFHKLFVATLAITLCVATPVNAADEYFHPYGIQAKRQTVVISSIEKVDTWRPPFHSVEDFCKTLQQPGFSLIWSGETRDVYYAFFRTKSDILIYVDALKNDVKNCGSDSIWGRAGSKAMVEDPPLSMVELLDTTVTAIVPDETYSSRNLLFGMAAKIKRGYSGPLTLNFEYHNHGDYANRVEGILTINWKSAL
jgi:hypothetical protein